MSASWFWPDWGACSDPGAESCSDAACPVHGDPDGAEKVDFPQDFRQPAGGER